MIYDKFKFFLRGADYLYFKNKEVFTREQVAGSSYLVSPTYIDLHPVEFKNACENPLYTPSPNLIGLLLGFLLPFQYRLYKELVLYTIIFTCLNLLFSQLFGDFSTLFFYASASAYYLFFTLYTKTLWARKLHQYLQYHPNATKKQILWRFRPHHMLTTLSIGLVYILFVLFVAASTVSLYFKLLG